MTSTPLLHASRSTRSEARMPTPDDLDRIADLIERACDGSFSALKDQLLVTDEITSLRRRASIARNAAMFQRVTGQ